MWYSCENWCSWELFALLSLLLLLVAVVVLSSMLLFLRSLIIIWFFDSVGSLLLCLVLAFRIEVVGETRFCPTCRAKSVNVKRFR